MKKRTFAALMMAVLLCLLAACTGERDPHTAPATDAAAEDEQPTASAVDYTAFEGNYSDTETVEGPCYTVSIIGVDNATGAIDIEISYVGSNTSPIYVTEPIHASLGSDHTAEFEWEDSWTNRGVGTLVLDPDDPSSVQLMMEVRAEAEVNRATLSTHGAYKTLMRR